jgi:hypothetical protein
LDEVHIFEVMDLVGKQVYRQIVGRHQHGGPLVLYDPSQ